MIHRCYPQKDDFAGVVELLTGFVLFVVDCVLLLLALLVVVVVVLVGGALSMG